MNRPFALTAFLLAAALPGGQAQEPRQISGIYPHLAMFNNEGECGTGAVVPWADRLWVITYGPHLPFGSSDKLYEITPELEQIIRPESVGGTPANRMIHRETQQLLIGPYVIDAKRTVRVISPSLMPGRLTGNARHLTDPANKAYYATMEEGLYEVDLHSLEVTGLIKDGNPPKRGFSKEPRPATLDSQLPGYHGKGLHSGQGRVVYANNGDRDKRVVTDPATPSGALGEWSKAGEDWKLVRRNQFTEVTGPGGIQGSEHSETDPIWSIGWDHRSLILMCLHEGQWHAYRLPKSSHSYDGAHGWNTEWPRIRDVGEDALLMTMHGAFWKFPRGFTPVSSAGIAPRSNYLKVIGDFARWGDRLVMGCDDTAKSEFLNKRKAKGDLVGPGRSQSNLWFIEPATLDQLGPVLGRGAVWLQDDVAAGAVSEPYLFSGYRHRGLTLAHMGSAPVKLKLEVDAKGDGQWTRLSEISVPPGKGIWTEFDASQQGAWIRATTMGAAQGLTVFFHYRNDDTRANTADPMFDGLSGPEDKDVHGGIIHARGAEFKNLRYLAKDSAGDIGCYDLAPTLELARSEDVEGAAWTAEKAAIPQGVLVYDAASVLYEDDKGRWRLPKGSAAFDKAGLLGDERVDREVCTERDLFNAAGTFFELPAENAGGVAKIRPVATHNRRIKDYASHRGLLIMTGLRKDAQGGHIVRSTDGKAALWVGAVDDLWKLGKPRGEGGPWKDASVKAGAASDPYLFTGYDKRTLTLTTAAEAEITIEADVSGTGLWVAYKTLKVTPGTPVEHVFSEAFGAYWLRFTSNRDTQATAWLKYE